MTNDWPGFVPRMLLDKAIMLGISDTGTVLGRDGRISCVLLSSWLAIFDTFCRCAATGACGLVMLAACSAGRLPLLGDCTIVLVSCDEMVGEVVSLWGEVSQVRDVGIICVISGESGGCKLTGVPAALLSKIYNTWIKQTVLTIQIFSS